MQKRRERIEKWRAEKKKNKEVSLINIAPPSKDWTLEDEEDDDDIAEVKQLDDDDVDPLDAFMVVSFLAFIYFYCSIIIILC